MILDNQLLVSDAQAITADAYSTNVVDLGVAGRNINAGEPMAFVITVDVAADGTTTDETYQFEIHESAAENMGSPTTLLTKAIGYASLTAGIKIVLPVPDTVLRYLALYYNVGGTSPTITCTAALMPIRMIDNYKSYPNGYTIS